MIRMPVDDRTSNDPSPPSDSQGEILLHICCAPCSTHSIDLLRKDGWKVTGLFYNPNICPPAEYHFREEEAMNFCEALDVPLLVEPYDHGGWVDFVREYTHLGEGSRRCHECFRMRLERCGRIAAEKGFHAFTTTLTISPHKNSKVIFQIGRDISKIYGIRFEEYNFKKKDGFKISIRMSGEHRLYRQDYCGCEYSMEERRNRK